MGTTWYIVLLCCLSTFSQAYWFWDGSTWQICDCNGLASQCRYDEELLLRTGNGGRCVNCAGNTKGAHCERCRNGYFRSSVKEGCVSCGCNTTGTLNSTKTLCDHSGRCRCKSNVTGVKCDRCSPGFFDLGPQGCRPCPCSEAGTADSLNACVTGSDMCKCKEHVEGKLCDVCKGGYFGLSKKINKGCLKCFCYRHSFECHQMSGYSIKRIKSKFNSGPKGWKTESNKGRSRALFDLRESSIGISNDSEDGYFIAPFPYLGNKLLSYGLLFSFHLKVTAKGSSSPTDIKFEGNGYSLTAAITSQGNPPPSTEYHHYTFRLDESGPGWQFQLSTDAFYVLFANITAIKLRAVYPPKGYATLKEVTMETAKYGSGKRSAHNVESCICPTGHTGRSCESCAAGYRRYPPGGGPFVKCIPCDCNGHADTCNTDSGKCDCLHHTTGHHCERCLPGYYGNAMTGNPEDCRKCVCPYDGECAKLLSGEVMCINCLEGYTGNQCTKCVDGYFGDPQADHFIIARPCRKCQCNGNSDHNAVGICDSLMGICRKCIFNTYGDHCEKCLPGYYGDALASIKGDCKPCDCSSRNSLLSQQGDQGISCDIVTGQCRCKANVVGRKCESCAQGFWNIESGNGCMQCNCHPNGVVETSICDQSTGWCHCKLGIVGPRCDNCDRMWYGFSSNGCFPCKCHPFGSEDFQCDQVTGRCRCKPWATGRQCDQCPENTYNVSTGCMPCPACYLQVKDGVGRLESIIYHLQSIVSDANHGVSSSERGWLLEPIMAIGADIRNLHMASFSKFVDTEGPIFFQLLQIHHDFFYLAGHYQEILNLTVKTNAALRTAFDDGVSVESMLLNEDKSLEKVNDMLQAIEESLKHFADNIEDHGPISSRMASIAVETRQASHFLISISRSILNKANSGLVANKEALRLLTSMEETLEKVAASTTRNMAVADSRMGGLNQIASHVYSTKFTVDSVYENSLSLFTQSIGLRFPELELIDLYNKTNHTILLSNEVKTMSNLLTSNGQVLIHLSKSLSAETAARLRQASAEFSITNSTHGEVTRARHKSQLAVQKAFRVSNQATETINILSEFDTQVIRNKDKAKQALLKVETVKDQISIAEEVSDNGFISEESFTRAEAAHLVSRSAQDTGTLSVAQATLTLDRLKHTKARASKSSEQLKGLTTEVKSLRFQWADRERQNNMDRLLSAAAIEDAEDTKAAAAETKQSAADTLRKIVLLLSSFESSNNLEIDVSRLDQLERELSRAEDKWRNDNVELKVVELEQSLKRQSQLVNSFTQELIEMESDVSELKDIKRSIPKQCFFLATLEPTNPQEKR